ncbi:MAG: hypothetical protein EBX50_12665 [Chitinophagia bacterium]|nr:hypothetical protein [Chitinophagia bacterium]
MITAAEAFIKQAYPGKPYDEGLMLFNTWREAVSTRTINYDDNVKVRAKILHTFKNVHADVMREFLYHDN